MTIHRRSLLTVLAAGSGVLAMPFAARAEGTLEAVKKRGTFRVGVTQAPPWFSKDPKTGQWSSGLGVSFGKAMADKLGVKMETVEVSWGNAIAALQADKIDIMFMIDATPERKQAVDRVQQIVADQQPFIYLVYPNALYAVSPRLQGVQPAVLEPGLVWNVESLRLGGVR